MTVKVKKFNYLCMSIALVGLLGGVQELFGVVFPSAKRNVYIKDINDLKPSLMIDTKDTTKNIQMSTSLLKARVKESASNPEVEPIILKVPKSKIDRIKYIEGLAKRNSFSKLTRYLNFNIKKLKIAPNEVNLSYYKVELDKLALNYINLDKLVQTYQTTTHDVTIKTKMLTKKDKKQLFKQTEEYLKPDQQQRFKQKLIKNKTIVLKKDLLPAFASKMIDHYIPFRGPNCFHAALAFQSEDFANSYYVNIKKQKGYHDYMINYDELWDSINHYFYEVNPKVSTLKYGDMIVFFDISNPDSYSSPHYTWIKHTATYLFSDYTFSKGSKSANTPYTIKTLAEEWNTWSKYVKHLGIKVFRKNNKYATSHLPKELNEWIY